MTKKGFYIKSIIATGAGMKTSRVDFRDGCNLLFGPSDSGKTAVFSIIDFMLGSKSDPKDVIESKGYDIYYMEFVTYQDGKVHTVCRNLKHKKFIVKDCAFESFENEEFIAKSYPMSSNTKETYSQYLMDINGYNENLVIRKNKEEKSNMSFAWARHLMLVSEERIVSTNPIFNPINDSNNLQSEKSFIYYLTTGEDDKDFINTEKEKIRTTRIGGMIILTEENIKDVDAQIIKLGDVSFADFKDEGFLSIHKIEIQSQESKLSKIYSKRTELEDQVRKIKSKILFISEFIYRMDMLHRHYQLDLMRYEHLYQGAYLFDSLREEYDCPLCNSRIHKHIQLNQQYLDAIQREYNIVKSKISDADRMAKQKKTELNELNTTLVESKKNLKAVENQIRDFKPHLDSLKKTLLRYQENIEKKAYATFLQAESQRLSKKLVELKKEQKKKPIVQEYNRQSSIDIDFCNLLREKLINWNVIRDEPVVFDEYKLDFELGEKKRLSCGKGTRGVTCAAIMMTLIEYCHSKAIPFTHLMVVDSPLTAHFNDGNVDADATTQSRFFKYCNDYNFDYQLILIDNKSPEYHDRKILNNIHYIEFSESGRKGFYLGKE